MSQEISTLMEMGFSKERAERALAVTNNKGVEPAMEWLLAHADEDIPCASGDGEANNTSSSAAAQPTSTNPESSTEVKEAKSLKCEDCGKLFKDASEIEYHAAKTNHSNFSESTEEKKPLTEEEKKAQLALLEEKIKKKRAEREEQEKRDALEREKNRIRSGKDMTAAKAKMEEMEMKKIVEQRKREKAEEKIARERVKAQIEADKAARKAKLAGEIGSPSAPQQSPVVTSPTTTAPKASPKEYSNTRIQVRLHDGSTLTETFGVKEQLSAVRVFIQMKAAEALGTDNFDLMTSFPRKVFKGDDYEKPLDVLGLIPSAVLIVTKAA